MPRHNKTGRSVAADSFHVRLYDWLLKSEAWQALTSSQRCVYLELEQRFFGNNNGRIGLSVRTAASGCHITKDTAKKAFDRLLELGFVECVTPGGFSRKTSHATEWRLTRARCDVTGELPSKAFMRWRSSSAEIAKRGPKASPLRSQSEPTQPARAA
jgi:hypothetical protein